MISKVMTWLNYCPIYLFAISIVLFVIILVLLGLALIKNESKISMVVTGALLIILLITILYTTLFGRTFTKREYVLIPLYTFRLAIDKPRIIRALLLNVVMFFPFGELLCILLLKINDNTRITRDGLIIFLIAFVISVLIEILQFYFALGRFEIDDILANTLGAFLGGIVFKKSNNIVYKRFFKKS